MIHWLAWSTSAWAGVWVNDEGKGYAQLTYVHAESGQLFLPGGELVSQTDELLMGHIAPLLTDGLYASNDISAYAEWGLGHGFEAVVSLPFRMVQNRWTLAQGSYPPILQSSIGFGDLTAGARYGGTEGSLAYSAYATGRVPLYDNRPRALNTQAGNSDFEDDLVPRGQGTLDLDVGGALGVGGAAGWGLLEAGIRVRTQGYSTAVPARAQLGVKPVAPWSLWVGADLLASLGDGSAPDDFRDEWGKGPIAIDNQSAVSVNAGTAIDIAEGFGLTAGVSHTVWGIRFPQITGVNAGFTYRFEAPVPWEWSTPAPTPPPKRRRRKRR